MASLIASPPAAGLLYLVAEVYLPRPPREGLGMGDPKMLAMIGAFLGWQLTS